MHELPHKPPSSVPSTGETISDHSVAKHLATVNALAAQRVQNLAKSVDERLQLQARQIRDPPPPPPPPPPVQIGEEDEEANTSPMPDWSGVAVPEVIFDLPRGRPRRKVAVAQAAVANAQRGRAAAATKSSARKEPSVRI